MLHNFFLRAARPDLVLIGLGSIVLPNGCGEARYPGAANPNQGGMEKRDGRELMEPRKAVYRGQSSYRLVRNLAGDAVGEDGHDHRAEFLKMVAAAERLSAKH